MTILIWVGQIAIFGYLIPFAVYQAYASQIGAEAGEMAQALSLPAVGVNVLESVPFFAIPVSVVLGVLLVAGDFQNRTFGLLVSRASRRWIVVVSRFVALAVLCLVMTVLAMLAALLMATILSGPLGNAGGIEIGILLVSTLASWLGMYAFAAFGACMAYIFKSSMPATMVALGWTLVVEFLVTNMIISAVPFFADLQRLYLSGNVGALAGGIGHEVGMAFGGLGVNALGNRLLVAVLALLVWILASVGASLAVVNRRDVN